MIFRDICYLQMIIVLIDETRTGINYKLELWREATEYKGLYYAEQKWKIWSVPLVPEGK